MAKFNQKSVWLDKMHQRNEDIFNLQNMKLEKSIGKEFRKSIYHSLTQKNKHFVDILSNLDLYDIKEVYELN